MSVAATALPQVQDDAITVGAIAIIAACIVTTDHEAVGHGSACLAAGGHLALLTSVYARCTVSRWWIDAAGPAGNLAMGTLAWFVFHRVQPHRVRLRLLLMMVTALSLFWEAGYALYSMVLGEGDWAGAAQAALPFSAWLWRPAGIVVGVLLYIVGLRATAAAARAVVGGNDQSAASQVRTLLRTVWVAASVSMVIAASTYAPDRAGAMRQAALEVGAASIALLFVNVRTIRTLSPTHHVVHRSVGWIGAAALVFVAFVATLGRGIH